MKLKKFISVILATAMISTMGSFAAMAIGPTDSTPDPLVKNSAGNETSVTLPLTKHLQMSEGITTPQANFTFTITASSSDAPAFEEGYDAKISYSSNDSTPADASHLVDVVKSSDNIFDHVDFEHAGEYVYTIAENNTGYTAADGTKMEYDPTEYELHVYVANKTGKGLYISAVSVYKLKTDGWKKINANNGIPFTNKYYKEASGLTISKTVSGLMADKTKKFSYHIVFTKGAVDDTASYISSDKNVTVTDGAADFQLADGESITFSGFRAGTRYTLKESGAVDYTPYAAIVSNGGTEEKYGSLVENAEYTSHDLQANPLNGTNLAGEKTNSAAFTNTYKTIVPAGIMINNLPYVLMGILAALGIVMFLFFKRRHEEN